jgi:hypothetical protein
VVTDCYGGFDVLGPNRLNCLSMVMRTSEGGVEVGFLDNLTTFDPSWVGFAGEEFDVRVVRVPTRKLKALEANFRWGVGPAFVLNPIHNDVVNPEFTDSGFTSRFLPDCQCS